MRKSWSLAFELSTLLAFAGVSYAATIETPLRDNVGIGEVSGGDKSNPLWDSEIGNNEFRGALRKSLDSAGVLERARGEGRSKEMGAKGGGAKNQFPSLFINNYRINK